MKFQLTIARKLIGLTAFAIIALASQGVAGLLARHYLTAGSDRVFQAQETLSSATQAGQAHDASRGDVLAMLTAKEIDAATAKAMRTKLDAHAGEMSASLRKLESMELDAATREAVSKLQPSLDAYMR